MAARFWMLAVAVTALTLINSEQCVWADAATPLIAHGSELSLAKVGPEAAGYAGLKEYAGGEIKDGGAYAFAREVPAAARYDGFDVPGPHLLIEGVSFLSALDISYSKPVVLRGVRVRPDTASPWAILTRPGTGPVLVLWSEAGSATTQGAPHDKSHAVGTAMDLRSNGATVYRSRLFNSADGLHISGSHVTIAENVIDDLTTWDGDHNDGIQLLGHPQSIDIKRNKIINRNPQTSCVTLLGDHVRVDGNYLAGGGWTLYGGAKANGHGGDAATDIAVSDTIFGRELFNKGGFFGPVTYWNGEPSAHNTWRDNRFSDGVLVRP